MRKILLVMLLFGITVFSALPLIAQTKIVSGAVPVQNKTVVLKVFLINTSQLLIKAAT